MCFIWQFRNCFEVAEVHSLNKWRTEKCVGEARTSEKWWYWSTVSCQNTLQHFVRRNKVCLVLSLTVRECTSTVNIKHTNSSGNKKTQINSVKFCLLFDLYVVHLRLLISKFVEHFVRISTANDYHRIKMWHLCKKWRKSELNYDRRETKSQSW